jgi:2-succinyl-6-hydroxy-2,4-cyclohexadiene-1-carboxylate synthase
MAFPQPSSSNENTPSRMVNTINIQGFPHAYELSDPTEAPIVLVFIHGWLLSRAYWQPVIERLSPHFQCLSYDLRGFGESQPSQVTPENLPEKTIERTVATVSAVSASNSASNCLQVSAESSVTTVLPDTKIPGYSPADYAKDLNNLLHSLNINQAWLLGHSLGGAIALWAADQSPATISGVICVNAGGGIYIKKEFEKFRAAGQQIVKFRPRWLASIPLLDLTLTRMSVAQPLTRTWGKQRLVDMLIAQPEAAIGALLDSTTESEVHLLPQVVARLPQPVHFITGTNDTVMEPKYVNHLASFHPSFECCGSNVTQIENCGHLAMLEQPDAVADEIQRILALHHS